MKRSRQSVVPQWKAEGQLKTALEQDDKGFYKSEGAIELRIDRFSKFVHDGEWRYSAPVYVRGLPWQIEAHPNNSDSSQSNNDSGQSPSKKLSVYLWCNKDSISQTWECEAAYTLRLMAQKAGAKDIIARDPNSNFNYKQPSWGYLEFENCDELLDPEEGYIKDDTIVLKAYVKPSNVKDHIKPEFPTEDERRRNQKRTMKRNNQIVVPQWKLEDQVMTTLEQDDKGFYKTEGTIELRIDRFAEFVCDANTRWSAPVYVRGLPWKIKAHSSDKNQSNDDGGQSPSKNLSVFLFCNRGSSRQTWECQAMYVWRIMAQKENIKDIRRNSSFNFNDKSASRGYANFANCDVLLDPEKGYIKDDTIVLLAYVKPLNVKAMPEINAIENSPLFSSTTKYPWDFVIIIQDNEVHVLKSILSLHSEYFKEQFSNHKRNKMAILEGVQYDEFIELLSIIYRTGCYITEENVETISKLALKFNMAGLLRECEAFLMKHTTKFDRAKALSIAESYGLVYLQGQIIDEIKIVADVKKMKPEYDTLSHRTKRMLFDKIYSSGPTSNPASGQEHMGITTSRATEILEELASSTCSASDGFLVVENKRIPIHKGYLAMCSEYFRAMFQGEFTERNKDEVVLENFRYDEILELLAVIYPTESTVTDQNIEVILKTAEYFNMPRILAQCKKLLQNSKGISVARKLWLAQSYHLLDLQVEYAKKFKRITDVEKLRAEPEYVSLDDQTRALILDSITS